MVDLVEGGSSDKHLPSPQALGFSQALPPLVSDFFGLPLLIYSTSAIQINLMPNFVFYLIQLIGTSIVKLNILIFFRLLYFLSLENIQEECKAAAKLD